MKLKSSFEEMRKKVDETNALLLKEREAAKKAAEEAPPVIKETQILVEDTKKIELMTEELESVKVLAVSGYQPANQFHLNLRFTFIVTY